MRDLMVSDFSLLIKPASADCNLRCDYCFYLKRMSLYPESRIHRMSDPVLEKTIAAYMATEQGCYTFGWQGGEPTLMGLPFFKRVTELQQKYGRPGAKIANGLQTNGTLLTEDFAAHLAEFKFLIGLSVDGPATLHDAGRVYQQGRGSHADVVNGMRLLRDAEVEFNVLTLVSRHNVDKPLEIYNYLKDLGINYHQYIECVEHDENGAILPFSINGDEWGNFLIAIFDYWYKKDTRKVSIRLFDTILTQLADGYDNTCASGKDCRLYLVVEYNGDVYPCDFFVNSDQRLGNITSSTWEDLRNSSMYRDFGARKMALSEKCKICPYLRHCHGDCPKNRVGMFQNNFATVSHFCDGWLKFYEHVLPRMRDLAKDVIAERSERLKLQQIAQQAVLRDLSTVSSGTMEKLSRNALCPCGSGKKYKRCCGTKIM